MISVEGQCIRVCIVHFLKTTTTQPGLSLHIRRFFILKKYTIQNLIFFDLVNIGGPFTDHTNIYCQVWKFTPRLEAKFRKKEAISGQQLANEQDLHPLFVGVAKNTPTPYKHYI